MNQYVSIHSKDLEESVIGIMITCPNYLPTAFDTLFTDCFYTEHCQRYFNGLKWLYDSLNTIDAISLIQTLRKKDKLSQDDVTDISRIANKALPVGFETHSKMLLEYYMKRKVSSIGQEFILKGNDETTDPFDILNTASSDLIKVQENISRGNEISISNFVDEVFKDMARAKETGSIGLDTGFKDLNKKIMGWVDPDLIIIAARPGMGKTAKMLSSVYKLAVIDNIPVAIFSLEMSGKQLVDRLIAIDTNISHERIRTGNLTENEMELLQVAKSRISNAPIHIDERANINISDIRTKAIIWKRKHGIKAIFIDYLQIMSGVNDRNKNRETVISEISRGCKNLAKELNIPVIALSQLSRAVETRTDKMPQLSDLRESGAIEQDADVVIFLMRPAYYGTESVEIGGESVSADGLIIEIIAKNRHGSTCKIKMKFIPHSMKFIDYENNFPSGNWKPVDYSESRKEQDYF